MFIDRIKVQLLAGKGGNGVVAWRREKYVPKGGPCGGNGGRGGDVIIQADTQLSTLDYFYRRTILKAEKGHDGRSNNCQGRSGEDLLLKVPCGTLIKDVKTGVVIADMVEDGQQLVICRGGRGGRGNTTFKTPTNQAPNFCTQGKEGETLHVEFELKLIAEVGLVGFPNAGKSTLTTSLTRVALKAAPYPFTTLHPNLGFITLEDYSRVFIADIPGIIEGAHNNRGLGFEFLRHIERTKLLLFVLDASGIDGRDPHSDWCVLRNELKEYNPELLERPHLVVLNKIDDDASKDHLKEFYQHYDGDLEKVIEASAITGEHLEKLRDAIKQYFKQ